MSERIVRSAVSEAIGKTTSILFKPFSWRKWLKLVFIAWLAGSLSGGISFSGFDRPRDPSHKPAAKSSQQLSHTKQGSPGASLDPSDQDKLRKHYEKKYWFENSLLKSAPQKDGKIPAWYMATVVWPTILVIVLLILGILWFFIWLSARFQFAWYHAIQTDEVMVGASFRRYRDPADSWMLFNITSTIIILGYFTAIAFPAIYAAIQVSRISPALIYDSGFVWLNFWPVILLLIFSLVVVIVIYIITVDFILPIMATERVYFMEAVRLWLPVYKTNRMHVWRYFGMRILASIVGSALTMALTVPTLILALLIAVMVFGPLYLLFMAWLKWHFMFWALVVLLGTPYVLVLLAALGACALPFSVFTRAFSLSFLSRLRTASL